MEFDVLFQDEYLVAIDKPSGILVHRSDISSDRIFVLQELRNQLNEYIYPVHRLDRPTSGVLLFAKSSQVAAHLSDQFKSHSIRKTYHTWVRGWFNKNGLCKHRLDNKEAQTEFKCLQQIELDIPQRGFSTSRYSFIEVSPLTGRYHQIRLHLKHLRHPILGDTKHGDGFQNNLIREHYSHHLTYQRLLLNASRLEFVHPIHMNHMIIHSNIKLPNFQGIHVSKKPIFIT
jgi:tRNA pseudouridine65 synthase